MRVHVWSRLGLPLRLKFLLMRCWLWGHLWSALGVIEFYNVFFVSQTSSPGVQHNTDTTSESVKGLGTILITHILRDWITITYSQNHKAEWKIKVIEHKSNNQQQSHFFCYHHHLDHAVTICSRPITFGTLSVSAGTAMTVIHCILFIWLAQTGAANQFFHLFTSSADTRVYVSLIHWGFVSVQLNEE